MDLTVLRKRMSEISEQNAFTTTTNFDINSLAQKIHATKAAQLNALRLKKVKKATA